MAVGLIYVCYVVLRLPLFLFGKDFNLEGGVGGDNGSSLWLAICVIIYQIQFSMNFLIYAVLVSNYRKAFRDIISMIFPCCFKSPMPNRNNDLAV